MTNENGQYKYLGILDKLLDDAQQNVCFETKNSVVAAGAGSGKTQVLATRFAWLVISKKVRASEILTLTFTNKAAAEMYQRIYRTLWEFANHKELTQNDFAKKGWSNERIQKYNEAFKDLTEDKRQLAKKALEDFAEAHIQTLDSYCAGILRQCANRYGIRPDFTTGSSDGERQVKDSAFSFVVKNMENQALNSFYEPGKIQDFAENTFAAIINNYTSLATPKNFFKQNFEKQSALIEHEWKQLLSELKNRLDEINSVLELSKFRDAPEKAAFVKEVRKLVSFKYQLDEISSLSQNDIISQNENCKKCLQKIKEFFEQLKITGKTKPAIKDVKIPTEKDDLIIKAKSICAFISNAENTKELNRLLDIFLEQTNNAKRISGQLSFSDINALALKILLENPDIRNQERKNFSKIMIDEFQDNNQKNRDLLYLLSLKDGFYENEPINLLDGQNLHDLIIERGPDGKIINDNRENEKLFFVGDEKQSIYKFRGAEVSVFNELSKENLNLEMSYNYRSTPELIQSFNILFNDQNGIFNKGLSDKEFEAQYKNPALKNGMPELPELTEENVPAKFVMLNKETFDKNDVKLLPAKEQLAYYIAKEIRTKIDNQNANDGEKLRLSDFAILDKSRTDRKLITKYLSLFNLTYQVDSIKDIFEDGIVSDFYNFFRICVYPSDLNAFTAYLTGPFAGLAENSAENVIAVLNDITYRTDSEEEFTFNPLDKNHDSKLKEILDDYEFEKFLNARDFYETNKKEILQNQITQSISMLWHKTGYKYETLLNKRAELCSEQFDMIYELARQADSNGKSIAWFIDQLDNLKKSLRNDDSDIDMSTINYPLERESAVQIMTIHKSKGLQFKHVFIYGCTDNRSKTENSTAFFDEEYGVSIKPEKGSINYFCLKQKEIAKEKEIAEFRRLLYVAITRAINSYYIVGVWTPAHSDAALHLVENVIYKNYPDCETAEPGKTYFTDGKAFSYTELEPVSYNDVPKAVKTELAELRTNIFEKIESVLKDSKNEIEFYSEPVKRLQPSKIELAHSGQTQPQEFSHEAAANLDAEDSFTELTQIIKKYAPESTLDETEYSSTALSEEEKQTELGNSDFTSAAFGTLIHEYLCKMAEGISPENFEPAANRFKNVEAEKDIQKIKEFCIKMCRNFAQTDFFADFCDAKNSGRFARSECAFKFYEDETIFTGSIDLLYVKADGKLVIIDYKTDQHIEPEIHFAQQSCYKKAAQIITGAETAECWLYYLRFNKPAKLPL